MEELTAERELQSLAMLESNLGSGDRNIREHFLYKGERPVGDGLFDHADIEPFIATENQHGSFVYSFIDSSLADESVLDACTPENGERTAFLRVAGSTLDVNGEPIVGTFPDASVSN